MNEVAVRPGDRHREHSGSDRVWCGVLHRGPNFDRGHRLGAPSVAEVQEEAGKSQALSFKSGLLVSKASQVASVKKVCWAVMQMVAGLPFSSEGASAGWLLARG
ncbi:hypothetical protein ABT234_12300 [Streptomyces sp. NPDC001586]|uniref:hypothetical protein n=1 Tax=Streptomyces sp. NPDC001586 TaxID=3154387 RepID=UPI00332C4A06